MARMVPSKPKEETVITRSKRVITIHRVNLIFNILNFCLLAYFLLK